MEHQHLAGLERETRTFQGGAEMNFAKHSYAPDATLASKMLAFHFQNNSFRLLNKKGVY